MDKSHTDSDSYLKCSFASRNWSWPNCMKPACWRILLCKICMCRKRQHMRQLCLLVQKNLVNNVIQSRLIVYIKDLSPGKVIILTLSISDTTTISWPMNHTHTHTTSEVKTTHSLLPGTCLWEYFSVLPLWGWVPPPLCDWPVGPGSVSPAAGVPGHKLP